MIGNFREVLPELKTPLTTEGYPLSTTIEGLPGFARHPSVLGCSEAVVRCLAVVERLDAAQFSRRMAPHDSIGNHLRHCLDHFTRLQAGIPSGLVDYDDRERDEAVASDPVLCSSAFKSVLEWLRDLDLGLLEKPLRLSQTSTQEGARSIVGTTLERELIFLAGHSVHHLAIVALIAERLRIQLPQQWAVAYSTAAYRKQLPK